MSVVPCACCSTLMEYSKVARLQGCSQAPSLGIVCACAEDIGSSFRSIMSLVVVFDICPRAALLAHLVLKPLKCTLVPPSRRMPVNFSRSEHGPRFWPCNATFEELSS